jgi:hypothetical protein
MPLVINLIYFLSSLDYKLQEGRGESMDTDTLGGIITWKQRERQLSASQEERLQKKPPQISGLKTVELHRLSLFQEKKDI